LDRTTKEAAVKQLRQQLIRADYVSLHVFQGLNVADLTSLRRELKPTQTEFQVVKNTLAIRAIQGTHLQVLEEHFRGPTAVAVCSQDAVASARVLTRFAKDNAKLQFKCGLLNGKPFSEQNLADLSKLPSREVLLSILLGALKAPANGLVNVLSGILRKFLGTLQAIEQEKSKTGCE